MGEQNIALVAIVKSPRDLALAARDHWYRIPLKKAPRRRFTHIAFYQPASFKPRDKRITRYARVAGCLRGRRRELFPQEPCHPAAGQTYLVYTLGPLQKLPRPILNTSGRRMCFGYAPLSRLVTAQELHQLFDTVPVENLICAALKSAGLPFRREHVVLGEKRIKYRLDLALFCKRGKLDIECDGGRSHSTRGQHAKDQARDLWLKRRGWTTLRFGEHEIAASARACVKEIKTAIKLQGGLRG